MALFPKGEYKTWLISEGCFVSALSSSFSLGLKTQGPHPQGGGGWILNGTAQCERNDKIRSGVKVAAATHDAVVQFPSILRKYAVGIKYFSNITGKKRERVPWERG